MIYNVHIIQAIHVKLPDADDEVHGYCELVWAEAAVLVDVRQLPHLPQHLCFQIFSNTISV
jgi:hypothetical protein